MGIFGDIAGAAGTAANLLGIGAKAHDKRQEEQQQKLTNQQVKANKELANHSQALQFDMWNKTNYEAQKAHLEAAGLNPGLMYGMSGGGGATTGGASAGNASGGQAANSAATQQSQTAMGMQIAQLGLLQAQTEKTKAEAEKIKGVDTAKGTAETTGIQFQNEINKAIGVENFAMRYKAESDRIETASQKEAAEWETWKAAGFTDNNFDDPDSPMATAIRAGWAKTVAELEGAKLSNDGKRAENVVKEFEAGLAREGISPNSPWWVKIVGDLLTKTGIALPGENPITGENSHNKKTIPRGWKTLKMQ